jgi:putative ATP-binding cassette transporter
VLVISHDDRYFHLADRLIRMENGQIVAIETPVARDPATLAPAELAAAQ